MLLPVPAFLKTRWLSSVRMALVFALQKEIRKMYGLDRIETMRTAYCAAFSKTISP